MKKVIYDMARFIKTKELEREYFDKESLPCDNCEDCDCEFQPYCLSYERATELVNAGYGNINESLTEFAERLYKKAEYRMDCDYDLCITVTVDDIQETLKEFLENEH